MTSRDRNLTPPGRGPEEDAGLIDEAPLPPPPGSDAAPPAPEPIDPDDPLLSEPLGALVPNDPVSEGIPPLAATESPHGPAHTGNRPDEPNSSRDAPEVPSLQDW